MDWKKEEEKNDEQKIMRHEIESVCLCIRKREREREREKERERERGRKKRESIV
jgi:hypothetical protein